MGLSAFWKEKLAHPDRVLSPQAYTQCSAALGTSTLSARSGVHSALSAQ